MHMRAYVLNQYGLNIWGKPLHEFTPPEKGCNIQTIQFECFACFAFLLFVFVYSLGVLKFMYCYVQVIIVSNSTRKM